MLRLPAFRVPLSEYQSSWWARFRSNILFSFATARVASDTQSTDIAWGIRAPIYDGGDPLAHREYTRQLGEQMLKCAPTPMTDVPLGQQPGETAEQFRQRFAADTARLSSDTARRALLVKRREEQLACLEKVPALGVLLGTAAADSMWNATRLIIAYAGSSRLDRSSIKSRSRLEDRIWIVGAIPLWSLAGNIPVARSSQLVGYADFVSKHAVDTVPSSKGASYGARLNVGSATLNAFGELLGQWRDDPPAGAKATTSAYSGGIEFLAAPGMWISTGVGRRYSDLAKTDKTVVLANIRWGISSKSFLSGSSTP
jgi:hypothetical protein